MSKHDLTGQRFGKLVAVAPTEQRRHGCVVWRCRCDCGNEILLPSSRLKPGVVENCGCVPDPIPADLTGYRFGRLTVIEKTARRSANGYVIWRCQCDCGNVVESTRDKLRSGNTTSCGCAKTPRRKDWAGRQFGNLTVLAYAGKRSGSNMWRCRCICGAELEVRQSNLQNGCSTSCGCKNRPADSLHFVDGTCVELIRSKTRSKANTSGVRGVYYNPRRGKWVAQIVFKRKCYYLGGYDRLEDAARARARGEEMYDDFLSWYYGARKTP